VDPEVQGQLGSHCGGVQQRIGFTAPFMHWYSGTSFMKVFFKRHWPLIGVAAVLVVAGLYLLHSLTGDGNRGFLGGFIPGEGLRLNRIHYTHEDPERGVRWELDAGEMTFSEDRNFMVFTDFLLKLEPEARPAITIRGERGEYEKSSGLITLTGNVDAETADGYGIFSDHLLVQEKERTVCTHGPVTLSGPSFSVSGTGLFVDLRKETLEVKSQVTTKIISRAVGL
jgi:LPS export ABC transporter protein LptC